MKSQYNSGQNDFPEMGTNSSSNFKRQATVIAVIAAIIIGVILIVNYSKPIDLYVYNGLDQSVEVKVGDQTVVLSPMSHEKIQIEYDETYLITASVGAAHDELALIESFEGIASEKGQTYIYNVANAAYMEEYTVIYSLTPALNDYNNADNNIIGAERWFTTKAEYVFTEAPDELEIKSGASQKRVVLATHSASGPYSWPITLERETDSKMIENHVNWDAPNSEHLLSWFQLSTLNDSTYAFVDEREKRFGFEVSTQRFLYDISDSLAKKKMSLAFNESFKADSDNSDLFYLKTRCEADEKLHAVHFEEGHNRWKDNQWLALAVSYGYANKEEWNLAYEAADIATKNSPMLTDYIGEDFERYRRVIDPDLSETLYENTLVDCDQVVYLRALARGDGETLFMNPDACLYNVSIANLDRAKTIADEYPDARDYCYYYIATSHGAPSAVVDEVLTWDNEKGISASTIWLALALRAQNNFDYKPLAEMLPLFYGPSVKVPAIVEFLNAVTRGEISKAEKMVNNSEAFHYKYYFALIGTIVLGDQAPMKWQFLVDRVLSITEKPFLLFTYDAAAI